MTNVNVNSYIKNNNLVLGNGVDLERRFGEEDRKRRLLLKENEKIDRERKLYHIKEKSLQPIYPQLKQIFGMNCTDCISKKSMFDSHEWRKSYMNIFDMPNFNSKFLQMDLYIQNWIFKTSYQEKYSKIIFHPGQIQWIRAAYAKFPENTCMFLTLNDDLQDAEIISFIFLNCGLNLPKIVSAQKSTSIFCSKIMKSMQFKNQSLIEHFNSGEDLLISLQILSDGKMFYNLNESLERDFTLIPVCVNYDRKDFSSNLGSVRINFCEPYSFQQLLHAIDKNFKNYSTDLKIIRHLQIEIKSNVPLMITNVLAFLLLTKYRNGVNFDDLKKSLREFRLVNNSKMDINFIGEEEDLISYAASVIGHNLIIFERQGREIFVKPNLQSNDSHKIYKYMQPLLHFFVGRSIVAFTAKQLSLSKGYIDIADLIEKSVNLCDLYYYELFNYKYCKPMDTLVTDWINELCYAELLIKPTVSLTEDQERARRIAQHFEDSNYDSEETESDVYDTASNVAKELIKINFEKESALSELNIIIEPINEVYMATIECLSLLIGISAVLEQEFISVVMKNFMYKLQLGIYKYPECVSKETIQNCIKVLQNDGIIQRQKSHGVFIICLNSNYSHGDITNKIQEFKEITYIIH